jgi:hypothetical protein
MLAFLHPFMNVKPFVSSRRVILLIVLRATLTRLRLGTYLAVWSTHCKSFKKVSKSCEIPSHKRK